jgi:hypothetical protein
MCFSCEYLYFKYYFSDIRRSTELKDLTYNEVDTKERNLSPPFSGHCDDRKIFQLILQSVELSGRPVRTVEKAFLSLRSRAKCF